MKNKDLDCHLINSEDYISYEPEQASLAYFRCACMLMHPH